MAVGVPATARMSDVGMWVWVRVRVLACLYRFVVLVIAVDDLGRDVVMEEP